MATLTEFNRSTCNSGHTVEKVEIEIINGIEYKLFSNQYGPALRVFDIESGEIVGLTNFKSEAKAGAMFDAAVAYARRVA